MAVLARPLYSKHSLQNIEHLQQRVIGQYTQVLNQAISIDSPELISNHVSILIIKTAKYAKRIGMSTCGKWRDKKRAEIGVQLIRRDDNAWPRFPDV